MTRRIKVLQLQPDYNVKRHDFADLAEQIVLSLPAERYEVVSAFLKGRPADGEPVSRAERSVYFEFTDAQLKGARLRALWRLYRFCRDEAFDVAICNRFKPVNMMLMLNRWLRIPACIGIAHNLGDYDRRYRRGQVRRLADRRWRFVGVSPAVRRELLDLDCGFTQDNTVAITNAIDIGQAESLLLEGDAARRELGLDPAARVVGTIGRQVPVKDYPRLIRAFARVAGQHPEAALVLIGDGREAPRLRDEVARLGLQGRVHLPGARPSALRYVRAFDIWAMPSLEEGFPLALLEAMSGRLPVIASDIPSMHELVSGAGGQLVPAGDEAALAAALDTHLALPVPELKRRGQAAYDYLCARHGIADYRRAYRALVDETLAANPRSAP
jgi:glycosyltransferase involved in cell wall biosynthesis